MNDHVPALCSEAVCAACDAYGAGCSRGKDAPSEALPELARVGNPVTLRPCYYSASALVLLRRRLRRGADPLSAFPEEDNIALPVHDEILTQQLSRRTEAATKGSRRLSFVRGEPAGLTGLELVDVAHVLAHYRAALSR